MTRSAIRAAAARPDPRSKLSRERVTGTARAILRSEGLDALTMRRLAADLDVAPMTLYTYVRDKDDLLDAVVQATAREIPLPPRSGPWKAQMKALMTTLHSAFLENPFLVQLRMRGPIVGPDALRINEAGLRILREAGFTNAEAARGYRALLVVTYGFAAFGPPATAADDERMVDAALGALGADEYPNLVAARRETVDTHRAGPGLFDYLLTRTLDGIEQRGARSRSP
jgi:AcrR family transcriptional regulator